MENHGDLNDNNEYSDSDDSGIEYPFMDYLIKNLYTIDNDLVHMFIFADKVEKIVLPKKCIIRCHKNGQSFKDIIILKQLLSKNEKKEHEAQVDKITGEISVLL